MVSDPALVLWDIDSTLLSIRGVSREIYARAFELVTGCPLQALADMAGRTERAIIHETLQLNGVPDTDETFERLYAALGDAAVVLAPRMRAAGEALPGAAGALRAAARDGVVQSVVTGNLRSIARTKLDAFGLSGVLDLDAGGFGDDDHDRAVLVRRAQSRASAKYGITFDPKRVVVVGDTPHDVIGAHDAGVLAVGVASGRSSIGELRAAGAEVVLPSLEDTAAIATAIFGTLLHDS